MTDDDCLTLIFLGIFILLGFGMLIGCRDLAVGIRCCDFGVEISCRDFGVGICCCDFGVELFNRSGEGIGINASLVTDVDNV